MMLDIKVSEAGNIVNLLKNLKPKKAAIPDRIKPVVLRELREELAPIPKILFERSLEYGVVPLIWNSANVSTIFKKGENQLLSIIDLFPLHVSFVWSWSTSFHQMWSNA